MGEDFPTETETCSKCGKEMEIHVRLGDGSHATECGHEPGDCLLLAEQIEAFADNETPVDIGIFPPED